MIVANSVTDLIGKTPIVRINNLVGEQDAENICEVGVIQHWRVS